MALSSFRGPLETDLVEVISQRPLQMSLGRQQRNDHACPRRRQRGYFDSGHPSCELRSFPHPVISLHRDSRAVGIIGSIRQSFSDAKPLLIAAILPPLQALVKVCYQPLWVSVQGSGPGRVSTIGEGREQAQHTRQFLMKQIW